VYRQAQLLGLVRAFPNLIETAGRPLLKPFHPFMAPWEWLAKMAIGEQGGPV